MSVRDTKRGIFIVMEGMDGSGKSVGSANLANFLKEEGLSLVETREIGGTSFGESIRSLIFNSAEPVDPLARMLACLSARQQHVKNVIAPAIERGDSVLCDRFFDSTFVYQACLDGEMSAYYELAAMRNLAQIFRRPDITIFFEVDPEVAFERGTSRVNLDNDQYKRSKDMAIKVAESYRVVRDRMTIDQRKNMFVIDGNKTIDEVKDQLRFIAKRIVKGYLDPS